MKPSCDETHKVDPKSPKIIKQMGENRKGLYTDSTFSLVQKSFTVGLTTH